MSTVPASDVVISSRRCPKGYLMAAARSILVSFAAKPHIDDVEQMLRKFGFHVCILANDVWLEDRVDESARSYGSAACE